MPRTAPSLPDGLRIYAVGDVHGRLDLLTALAAQIDGDIAERPVAEAIVIFLGDYIDRGAQSRGVIDWLMEAPSRADRRICLMGNHEEMLLTALADPGVTNTWLYNGGDATLASYGVTKLPTAPEARREALNAAIPPRHRAFLAALPRRVEFGTYLFVHAGIDPSRPLDDQDPEDLLWIRQPFHRSNADFGRIVVHGHTPVREPDIRANRINIDTGAVFSDRLTAIALEGATQRILQTGTR